MIKPRIPVPIQVDSYQSAHPEMIPGGMEDFQLSHGIFRKPLFPDEQRLVVSGVHLAVKNFFLQQTTHEDVDKAVEHFSTYYLGGQHPFPEDIWRRVVDEYNGYMPIVVQAQLDGSVAYVGEPVIQVWTDQEGMGELVGWIESSLLPYLYTCTNVATRGRVRKERMMDVFAACRPSLSRDEIHDLIQFQFHDFGRRGAPASTIQATAHLLNWPGTDTTDAAYLAKQQLNDGEFFGAGSIPAAAHRTVTPWLKEKDAYQRMIDLYADQGPFSVVADSYDYFRGAKMLAGFSDKVLEGGGKLVVRPDSGDPVECVVSGLKTLAEEFPVKYTDAGLKVIEGAGIIQGDGIDDDLIFDEIYPAVVGSGFDPINVVFGMGESNLNSLRSDTELGYKTAAVADGEGGWVDVMKTSNSEFKTSIPGPVSVDRSMYDGVRVQEESMKNLVNSLTGDLRRVYDGRFADTGTKTPVFFHDSFQESMDRAYEEWNKTASSVTNEQLLSGRLRDKQARIGKQMEERGGR